MRRRIALVLCALLLGLQMPLGSMAQVSGPVLDRAWTLDEDSDGRIDVVVLDFDARIDELALRLSDFTVQGHSILGYNMPSDSNLRLLLKEAPGFNSGSTPSIKYTVAGSGGQKTTGTVIPDDEAAPVLVSVLAQAGDPDVRARWSEPVQGATNPLTHTELQYNGATNGGATAILSVAADGSDTLVTLNNPVTAQDLAEDSLGATVHIQDSSGNLARLTPQPLKGPRIVSAVSDIGSDEVRVFFNVPLATVPGAGSFDVVYDQPPADPIAGVTDVRGGGSPDEVIVTLTSVVKPADVRSLEPASLSASPDNFKARGIHNGETISFSPTPIPLVDHTAPRVIEAVTQDRNRNGLLDAMLVTLSEPGVSTCTGGDGQPGIRVTLHADGGSVPYVVDHGPGQVPTAVDNDGRILLIRLQERSTHDSDTGLTPELTVGPCGSGNMPFEDLAEVGTGNSVRGNDVLPVGVASVFEKDGAPPVVLRATSQDRDQDGLLDAYVLKFSEPLVQSAFTEDQWVVVGHPVTGGIWDESDTLILELEEDPAGSSSDLPRIQYTGGDDPEDLRDPSGNLLERFDGGNFEYVDDAGPRILRVFGDVGQSRLRIEFSEPVEGVDSESSGPGRNLQESDFFYQDAGSGVAGITAVEHTRGERVAFLILNAPLVTSDLSDDGQSGDAVFAVEGRIREANGDAAKDRALVSGEPVHLLRLDVDPPGAPGSLDVDGLVSETTITTAALTFTAPSDDAGLDATGPVAGYQVYVSKEPIPDAPSAEEVEALRANGTWATVSVAGQSPAEPGQEEVLTIAGLCPSTTYHFGIEAIDDFGNPSVLALVHEQRTLDDDTPAMGGDSVQMLSASHPLNQEGIAQESTKLTGTVALDGFTDPEACGLDYLWVIDNRASTVIEEENITAAIEVPEAPGGTNETLYRATEPAVRFDLSDSEPPVLLWLHVAALSTGGLSETYHYPLQLVLPVDCIAENLLMSDLMAVRERGSTTITWGEHKGELPDGIELKGYQVWMRPAKGSILLRDEVEPPSDGFEERRYLDDLKLRKGDSYLVTAYFTDDLCRLDWDETSLSDGTDPGGPNATFGGTRATLIKDPSAVPVWAWVTLTVVAILVIGGLVLFFNLRHQRLDESWLNEDEDTLDPDNPFGSDPIEPLDGDDGFPGDDSVVDPFGGNVGQSASQTQAVGAESLDVTCPACTHQFKAQGARPLHIVCPNCSASGTLE